MTKPVKADNFKRWPISANAEKGVSDEIEQRVLLNSLDILQGALWMLKREWYRHQKDLLNIMRDIEKLERMGITLPPCLKLDLWFEIPSKDERTGNGLK
jgi:hypothetical protein